MIEWNENFITGNKILDDYHKQLVQGVNELYEMLSDTKNYFTQMTELTKQMQDTLIEHIKIENDLFKNLSNYEAHKQNHDKFLNDLNDTKNYNLTPTIITLMVSDIIIRYFLEHFLIYDKNSIEELNTEKGKNPNP